MAEMSHAKISLFSDKVIYHGGKIDGKVTLLSKINLTGCFLKVFLRCYEKAKINEKPEKEIQRSILPEISNMLVYGTNTEKDKEYNFPFDIRIPTTAPASFEAQTEKGSGKIYYCISAIFDSKDYPQLEVSREVQIREHHPLLSYDKRCTEREIQGCCGAPKGTLKVYSEISQGDLLHVHPQLEGTLSFDNKKCKFAIKKFQVVFYEMLLLHFDEREITSTTNIGTTELGEVPALEEKVFPLSISIPCTPKFSILCSSSRGNLVKRLYFLGITPVFETQTSKLTISIPINIEQYKTDSSLQYLVMALYVCIIQM